jgi:hypothetical protein
MGRVGGMQASEYRRWQPPQSPVAVEFPDRLLREVRLESSNRAGTGTLYGRPGEVEVRVLAARCDPDEQDPRLSGLEPVGIFAWRPHGAVFLTEEEVQEFEQHHAKVALVIAGERAGFFVREADGSIQAVASHEEFAVAEVRRKKNAKTPARSEEHTLAAKAHVEDLPPQRKPRAWQWAAALAGCALLAAPITGLAHWERRQPAPGLTVSEREGQLLIHWNTRAVAHGAYLEIADGDQRTVLPVSPGETGLTYQVQSGDVDVRLSVRDEAVQPRQAAVRLVSHNASAEPIGHNSEGEELAKSASSRIDELELQARSLRESIRRRERRVAQLQSRITRAATRAAESTPTP